MKQILPFLPILILLSACSQKDEYLSGAFNPGKIKAQVFRIRPGTDTILVTKAGVQLKIGAHTFQSTNNLTEVELKVQEIISKSDLVRSGIPTLDDKGQLLESGGMIKVQTNPRLAINPDAPILASIPVSGANLNMKKYTADLENGDFAWKEAGPLAHNPDFDKLAEGAQLFMQHCTPCHAKNLETKLVGPALGCIEQGDNSRTREWLIKFTKNSQKMMAQGDKWALCNWAYYRPLIMSDFEFLSDTQINHIYDYINNESIRRNICYNGDSYGRSFSDVPDCNDAPEHRSANEHQADTAFADTTGEIMVTRTYYYILPISDYQWINTDRNPFDAQEVDAFRIDAEKDLEIFLIFKNRKSLWPFTFWEERYVLVETENIPKIKLPVGEPVTILAFGKLEKGKRKYCEIQTTVKPKNDFKLTLNSISEDAFQKSLAQYK